MPTDRHDDAARVGCPVCMGDGTTPRHGPGAATFRKPCKECKRVAALLRETERKAVLRCHELVAMYGFTRNALPIIRTEYPEHFTKEAPDGA